MIVPFIPNQTPPKISQGNRYCIECKPGIAHFRMFAAPMDRTRPATSASERADHQKSMKSIVLSPYRCMISGKTIQRNRPAHEKFQLSRKTLGYRNCQDITS